MTDFVWHMDKVPDGMPIRQVYGFCFDSKGRLLMRVDDGRHNLPGGRPEPSDTDLAATLTRECLEEVNVVIRQPVYLGYQCVDDGDGRPPYAQVRMIAAIIQINEARPDPDNGRTYQRLLTSAQRAGLLLNWGDIGRQQTAAAAHLAETVLGLPAASPASDTFA